MSVEELYEIYKMHPDVCTDSRAIRKGCIFFALKGGNFNGNSFAEQALGSGASYAVIDEDTRLKDERLIRVDNVLESLQRLANYHRRQLHCPVIAVTGSNGKTTSKELISRVLGTKFNVHYTQGNLNNHIGVPLTVLSAPPDCGMLIVEMGANHQKEIEMLCAIAMPDYGIITNVGKAHLEGFGGFEGVKKGKGELYEFLAAHHGSVFVNGDNEHLAGMVKKYNIKRKIVYGKEDKFDCSGKLVSVSPFLKIEWKAGHHHGTISSQLVGGYNFENILAAVCIGNYFGVAVEEINHAIETYIPDNARSQIIQRGTNTVLLDAYNANPASMEAALKNFSMMEGSHKMVCLGEMAELGDESKQEHEAVLLLLKKFNFENVVLVGGHFSALSAELPAHYFSTSEEARDWMKGQKISGSIILIKGSRSTKMEKVLDAL